MKLTNDAGGQDLLPGIPDHITIQNIAPKISWETCNVLQMVNRGWQQAIYNRSVYNSKVSSKSTEGFLVLPLEKYSGDDDEKKLVFILYSCNDGSFLRLPPPLPNINVFSHQYICLDGKVYVWIVPCRKRSESSPCPLRVEVRVLDLAGDRRWTRRKQLKRPFEHNHTYSYGVLDGKIYRFQKYNRDTVGNDFNQLDYLRHKVRKLPQTEVYDTSSDVWSFITPKRLKNVVEAPKAELERHLACFSEWTREQMAVDVSKNFLGNGRYKSYFSEWRRGRQAIYDGTPSILDDCQHAMAMQVYHKTPEWNPSPHYPRDEDLFFCGDKLLKFCRNSFNTDQGSGVLQMYNIEENTWENWKSFSIDIPVNIGLGWPNWDIYDWIYADNAIWAIGCYNEIFLLRSPMFLNEESDKSFILTDSLFVVQDYDGFSMYLRPIYL